MKKGWQTKTLGDLFDITSSKRVFESDWKREGVPFYRAREIVKLAKHGYVDNELFISEEMFEAYSTKYGIPTPGDIMVTGVGTLGICYVVKEGDRFYFKDGNIIWLKKRSDTESRFVEYAFQWDYLREQIDDSVGATVGTYTIIKAKSTRIPVPPLAEQQRIVGVLDGAFAGLATAKANAEKNLQNARALFESHLHSVFTQRGTNWERVTLETLLERGWIESHLDGNHGGDYPRKDEFISEGVPYISANCLDDERIDMTCAKYLSTSRSALLRKGIAKNNDVLFAHNATVGPVAILRTDEPKVILGTSLTYYRCNSAQILPEYLAHYMRSFDFKTQYLQVMRQSTRNQVPITKQREFFHIIPPLDEQTRIIGALDGLFESGRRLETLYTRKLAALAALKKSLLHQAFSGNV